MNPEIRKINKQIRELKEKKQDIIDSTIQGFKDTASMQCYNWNHKCDFFHAGRYYRTCIHPHRSNPQFYLIVHPELESSSPLCNLRKGAIK